MEFFRTIDFQTTQEIIQDKINLQELDTFLTMMFILEHYNDKSAKIGSHWGEFTLKYDKINGGVRFYLVECPNALAWTITTGYDPTPEKIILHLTINRKEKEQKFIEEINAFLDDWEEGLKNKIQY